MPRQKVLNGCVRLVHCQDGTIELRVKVSGAELAALTAAAPKKRSRRVDVRQFNLYDYNGEPDPAASSAE